MNTTDNQPLTPNTPCNNRQKTGKKPAKPEMKNKHNMTTKQQHPNRLREDNLKILILTN